MKQESDKRIVSKAEYALARERRAGQAFAGLVLCLVTVTCAVVLIISIVNIIIIYIRLAAGSATGWEGYNFLILGSICLVFGFLSYIAGFHARTTVKEVAANNLAILFTIADVPESDSLVRASQEPLQAQQSVLLRAALETTNEQHEEELLRASAGGQEQR